MKIRPEGNEYCN